MIEWYEDNSMEITQTVVGSDDAAIVTATIFNNETGVQVWTDTLDATATEDEYSTVIHPADAVIDRGTKYRLRIVATFGGATLEFEEAFSPRVRRD